MLPFPSLLYNVFVRIKRRDRMFWNAMQLNGALWGGGPVLFFFTLFFVPFASIGSVRSFCFSSRLCMSLKQMDRKFGNLQNKDGWKWNCEKDFFFLLLLLLRGHNGSHNPLLCIKKMLNSSAATLNDIYCFE